MLSQMIPQHFYVQFPILPKNRPDSLPESISVIGLFGQY
jgi:hypothetical protein